MCQIPWVNNETPEQPTAIALNSVYGVIAIGTSVGMALVDLISSTVIYTWHNSELYNRDSIPFSLPSQNSDASPSEVCFFFKSHFMTLTTIVKINLTKTSLIAFNVCT